MPIAILVLLVQIGFCVHAVRTGRQLYWLLIIMMFPLIGCAIYFIAEMLPELRHSRGARQMAANVQRSIDPGREMRRLEDELQTADTVQNRKALADEHLRRGNAEEAIRLYRGALTGVHRDDPAILLGLARAQLAFGDAAGCIASLDQLQAANPRLKSADGHLLYARALEADGRIQDALNTYHAAAGYFPGGEAKCRYALLLKSRGHVAEASALFHDVVRGFEKAKNFQHPGEREWYEIARHSLEA